MNRKQFLIVLVALIALAAAGAGIVLSERQAWTRDSAQVGLKLVPALRMSDVAEITIRDAADEVHLAKREGGWVVRERADFPADVERIGDLLMKAADVKIAQAEKLPESQRARLQLVEPGLKTGQGGAKAVPGAPPATGTLLELKDAKGGTLARLLLGKKVLKQGELPGMGKGEEGVPVGRYVVSGADTGTMLAVSDPFTAAEPKPTTWLAKELVRVEPAKSITAYGPEGKARWTLGRSDESGYWRLVGTPEQADLQKAQDAASALTWLNAVDVVVDPGKAETGLDRPVTIKGSTFDNIDYTVKIGNKSGDNYYVAVAVSGEPAAERPAVTDETAEDKAKKDKEFAERRKKVSEKVEREKKLERWTYLVNKSAIEPLLRDRAQLLPDKKKDAPKR
jgi:hypothetical protein